MRSPSARLRIGLALGFCLMAVLGALATGAYVSQSGRHLGADYAALAGDIVRAQEETAELRLALEGLMRAPGDSFHRQRVGKLLWLLPERMAGVRQALRRSELPRTDYSEVLGDFDQAAETLEALEGALAREAPDAGTVNQLGGELESTLAWAYSRLLDSIHGAAAEQRRLMKRLSLAVVVLLLLVLMVAGALMLALARIHRQWLSLHQLSVTDELTGLANRRRLWDRAQQQLALNRRDEGELSLLLADLDHFKHVNDRFGHPTGDAVLQAFSRELARLSRESDLVARLGGEEFAVLMPNTGIEGARRLGERLREATASLALPDRAQGHRLTISLGLAATHAGQEDLDQLYSRADTALYQAKQKGRNRLEIHTNS
ncbi:diguanylate cyclase [Halomonas beimenensis]|uniref:diguanylate cyclase n=1 Tax=Halomonas beimenensis TaxID=475662 RepID=A0A291P8E1_9GAMM|nr:GGDEF domain-containing protein [Halomonas beimenensis]ATJ83128.1 diguanylate cyclase/phosphodiesterase (GGDEF & EAL domains) with PAS/PAC sensor(s) [Halomonas beimenensis]